MVASAVANEPLDLALPDEDKAPQRCGPFPECASARGVPGIDHVSPARRRTTQWRFMRQMRHRETGQDGPSRGLFSALGAV
ncbi:hypothetical protein D1007_33405 [Hordeum vulgare]|nr:hypothetical protein D1007_33405 [Hordeum vulgare]